MDNSKTQGYVAPPNKKGDQKEWIQPEVIGHTIIKGAYKQDEIPAPDYKPQKEEKKSEVTK